MRRARIAAGRARWFAGSEGRDQGRVPCPVRVKLATFNINGVNRRLRNLLAWLAEAAPDVVCLQELKAAQGEFPEAAIRAAGYQAAWVGQRSWNGVAILARGREPVVTRLALPGEAADKQARYLEAAVNGVLVGCLYAPNGNPQPGPKFDYKLAWFERLLGHAETLIASGAPCALLGDYNVVPTDSDIYATRSYADNALLQPGPRAQYRALLEQGWVDAIRATHPEQVPYTFWGYLRNQWPRDAGVRLDHLLLSPALAPLLRQAGVDKAVRGKAEASDHAPAWVRLGAARRARSGPPGSRP